MEGKLLPSGGMGRVVADHLRQVDDFIISLLQSTSIRTGV